MVSSFRAGVCSKEISPVCNKKLLAFTFKYFGIMHTKKPSKVHNTIFHLTHESRRTDVLHRISVSKEKNLNVRSLTLPSTEQPSATQQTHAVIASSVLFAGQRHFIITLCHWIVCILLSRQNKMKDKLSLVWTK